MAATSSPTEKVTSGAKGTERSPQRYAEFVAAYRRFPYSSDMHKQVAALVGCDDRTAYSLWHKGWDQYAYAPPIRTIVLKDERNARNALLQNENIPKHTADRPDIPKTNAQEDADRTAAIAARAQEARLIATARGNVIALQAIIASCLRGGLQMSRKVEEFFKTGDITPRDAFRMINRLGDLVAQSSVASKAVLEAERLRVGLPQAIIGLVPTSDMTPDQLVAGIQRGANAIQRAQRMGLVALPGGLNSVHHAPVIDITEVEPETARAEPLSDAEGDALDALLG